jgi:hypothetical protein
MDHATSNTSQGTNYSSSSTLARFGSGTSRIAASGMATETTARPSATWGDEEQPVRPFASVHRSLGD